MTWDEEPVKKRKPYEIGADLSTLSIAELEDYVAVLDTERERVKTAIASKKASRNAAASVFKS